MMRRPPITAAQVLARMKRGDLPTIAGGYTNKSIFEDGTRVSHKTMTSLHRAGKIEYPAKSSVYSPWTLTEVKGTHCP
jgi:hypothetical protein